MFMILFCFDDKIKNAFKIRTHWRSGRQSLRAAADVCEFIICARFLFIKQIKYRIQMFYPSLLFFNTYLHII